MLREPGLLQSTAMQRFWLPAVALQKIMLFYGPLILTYGVGEYSSWNAGAVFSAFTKNYVQSMFCTGTPATKLYSELLFLAFYHAGKF